nr:hypothetical protein [Tanacetum cinerariifolium]
MHPFFLAASGPQNIVDRRVTDDLIAFSSETTVPKGCIGQLTTVVAKLQAIEDQDEVHDSLLVAKDAKRGEESKLSALNEVIVEALADIETLETDVKILDGENNGGFRSVVAEVSASCVIEKWYLLVIIDIYVLQKPLGSLFVIYGSFFILHKLTKVVESSRLTDKMKVVFDQARRKEASFEALMRDVCCSLRVSLIKKRRLAAELEALGEQEDAVRDLESMKETVSRDSVTLADLEQLLARAQVGLGLKDGYLADVEEKA